MKITITIDLFNLEYNKNNCFNINCLENCAHNEHTRCTVKPILTIGNNNIICQSNIPI